MPYVPSATEVRRLRRAIERARFSEGERVFWLTSFALVVAAGAILATLGTAYGVPGALTAAGSVGFVFALFALYWRLRGVHASAAAPADERDLHSIGLRTREQRAFTALMLRHALMGRNPLVPRDDHDPLAAFRERTAQARE